jgi:hypothetical protein
MIGVIGRFGVWCSLDLAALLMVIEWGSAVGQLRGSTGAARCGEVVKTS